MYNILLVVEYSLYSVNSNACYAFEFLQHFVFLILATEEFLAEMDDDMEAMQSTVFLLQQELKDAKERLQKYENAGTTTTTSAAPPQSLDAQNGQSASASRLATIVEDQKEAEANVSSLDCNNGISVTTSAAVIHQGTGLEAASDGGLKVTESLGGLTVDRVGRVVKMEMDDSSVCEELSITAADTVKNHNSGCRTSPMGLSAPAAEHSGNFGSSISGPAATDCTDSERTHELGLRTAARKNAPVLEVKVNGLNLLVPKTEDVFSD